jgi:Threonine dehydratase
MTANQIPFFDFCYQAGEAHETLRYVGNPSPAGDFAPAARFGTAQAAQVMRFHRSMPTYRPTALHRLDCLAAELGLKRIFVKDESSRFGLNAFKGLGGSYCIGRLLAERAGLPPDDLTFSRLLQADVRAAVRGMTFVTATDGNHGRGVAWAARELGLDAVVYLPKGSSDERLQNIRRLGARAEILDLNYDDAVRYAAARADEHGWVLVQDTAWAGYEDIPPGSCRAIPRWRWRRRSSWRAKCRPICFCRPASAPCPAR